MENDKTVKVHSITEIPLGHKIALSDLKRRRYNLNMVMILVKLLNQLKKVIMFMFIMLKQKNGK